MTQDRQNITVAMWVHPDTYTIILEILSIIDDLDIDNDYTFQPHDVKISDNPVTGYYHFSIPIALHAKFVMKYSILRKEYGITK